MKQRTILSTLLFCALLLISNIAATKLIQLGPELTLWGFPLLPLITDGGALLFPLTYVLGDVLAETTAVPVPQPQPIRHASGRIRVPEIKERTQ